MILNPEMNAGIRRPAPSPAAARPSPFRAEELCLPLSRRTVLVSLDVVRAVYGVGVEAVTAKVDKGELHWVFDVASRGGKVREPRFWARELLASEACQMAPAQALRLMLGEDRRCWCSKEIQQLLLTSRATVMRWHRSGELPGVTKGRTFWVTRRAVRRSGASA